MKGVKAAVRGAQETLGFDSPSHMKGLQVFIADIRNCQTKEQERTRVDKELSKIRQKFANPKTLSGYDRKKYVWKLLYAYMLGYEIDDTGHFQAVELCSSPKFSEKTAGYLATSLLLADNNDMVRMIVNSVKTDISSGNEHMAALALNTVANIGGPEFADNLFTDIARMILTQANALSPYVKRKACICLLRLYRKENDGLQPEVWSPKLAALFNEQDIGLLTSASGFMLGILEMGKFPVRGRAQAAQQRLEEACEELRVSKQDFNHKAAELQKLEDERSQLEVTFRKLCVQEASAREKLQQRKAELIRRAVAVSEAARQRASAPAWSGVVVPVCQCLANLVQGLCPEHYEYYHVPAPWLQSKLLRILQFFPVSIFDAELLHRLNLILQSILAKPSSQRSPAPLQQGPGKRRTKVDAERQNRSNAEHAVLFEAMNLMIHLEDTADPETTKTAAGLLGIFLSSTDPNIRYLGLETMARLASNLSTHEYLDRYKNQILDKMHETDISIRRQALNLLYALCRPENWQQIVDQLLEILGSSDNLLQEELVLKIAILAEKNAKNIGWYVDVVFKMLESAPDAVSDDVWYRVVQVVTGFEDGPSEAEQNALRRHAASKAYQNLSSQRAAHDTLLRLGAYLIGEFGHLLPQSVTPRAKFEALHRHFQRGSPATKAILLLAAVKVLNANHEALKGEVLGFLREIQDNADVELQQRAVELLQLSRDEENLDQVLRPMPPYAESVQKNNPLVQRLKFSAKNRAHTRAELEEAAKSEGGMYKPGRGKAESDGRIMELPDPGRPKASSPASPKVQDASASESSDSEEDAGPVRSNGTAPAAGGSPKDLWSQLCITPQGRFYTSPQLVLELKQEYNAATGRLTITFVNSAKAPIGNIRVQIPQVDYMRIQTFSEVPTSLKPGEQASHFVQVQCMRPFLQPCKYLVEYCTAPGAPPQQLPLLLPAVVTKFMTPAQVQMGQFRPFFESLTGPRELVLDGQAKAQPNQWANYLEKGFNMFVLPESGPTAAFAAGTLNTATPEPQQPEKMMTVPVLVRLQYDAGRKLLRLIVRTQHPEVTNAIGKIMQSYLMTGG
ncbi:ALPHA-ADR [Symbiodinium sp. CCMP2592]|nr:ALPHA-ADR [Symbiodinium sp. CCMP2592]